MVRFSSRLPDPLFPKSVDTYRADRGIIRQNRQQFHDLELGSASIIQDLGLGEAFPVLVTFAA